MPTFGAVIAMNGIDFCFASLHECNQSDQCGRYCRGAKTGHDKTTAFNTALKRQA
jgi:hypothetical protein